MRRGRYSCATVFPVYISPGCRARRHSRFVCYRPGPVCMEVIRPILGIKVKMVCMSTGYHYPVPLSRQKMYTHILLVIAAYALDKVKTRWRQLFLCTLFGPFFHIETMYLEAEPAYPRFRVTQYMSHNIVSVQHRIQVWFKSYPNNNN